MSALYHTGCIVSLVLDRSSIPRCAGHGWASFVMAAAIGPIASGRATFFKRASQSRAEVNARSNFLQRVASSASSSAEVLVGQRTRNSYLQHIASGVLQSRGQVKLTRQALEDASAKHCKTVIMTKRRYDNSRRARLASLQGRAKPCSSSAAARAEPQRINNLMTTICRCPHEQCFRQLLRDQNEIIALIAGFSKLPKIARDEIIAGSNPLSKQKEYSVAGRQVGKACFVALLKLHKRTMRKGLPIDRRLSHWLRPRREPRARHLLFPCVNVYVCVLFFHKLIRHVGSGVGIAVGTYSACTSPWARHCRASSMASSADGEDAKILIRTLAWMVRKMLGRWRPCN